MHFGYKQECCRLVKMKRHKLGLHLFRRDLRLEDNTSLAYCLRHSERVVPCFIIDRRQTEKNSYCSENALSFMAGSLESLDSQLRQKKSRLFLYQGEAESEVRRLLSTGRIGLVTFNSDYTPFSRHRDSRIMKICREKGAECFSGHDCLITEPGSVLKDDGRPYTVFSHFQSKARKSEVRQPERNSQENYFSGSPGKEARIASVNRLIRQRNPDILLKGGREEGLELLRNLSSLAGYRQHRDFPYLGKTSRLSAHNKFGTISIREVYWSIRKLFGASHELISELYWRDFFTHAAWYFPYVFGKPFRLKYRRIAWNNSRRLFTLWCSGMTGFPIVDAGMRELNATGFMHNRPRMVAASFLVKDLHIDWRWGERYFATRLIDYDPAVNNGNWQWAASTGCDTQPYFRIFNPWRQQERFDSECRYVKRWVPELAGLHPKDIHRLHMRRPSGLSYPEPLVEHSRAANEAKGMYKAAAGKA